MGERVVRDAVRVRFFYPVNEQQISVRGLIGITVYAGTANLSSAARDNIYFYYLGCGVIIEQLLIIGVFQKILVGPYLGEFSLCLLDIGADRDFWF